MERRRDKTWKTCSKQWICRHRTSRSSIASFTAEAKIWTMLIQLSILSISSSNGSPWTFELSTTFHSKKNASLIPIGSKKSKEPHNWKDRVFNHDLGSLNHRRLFDEQPDRVACTIIKYCAVETIRQWRQIQLEPFPSMALLPLVLRAHTIIRLTCRLNKNSVRNKWTVINITTNKWAIKWHQMALIFTIDKRQLMMATLSTSSVIHSKKYPSSSVATWEMQHIWISIREHHCHPGMF